MTYLTKTIFAILLPNLAFADQFDGVYKQTTHSECALIGVDGGALEIKDGIFHGVEMQCRMVNPVDITDMTAIIYQMECSGAGQTWTERSILMDDADATGIIMVWNGYAFRYERCGDGEY